MEATLTHGNDQPQKFCCVSFKREGTHFAALTDWLNLVNDKEENHFDHLLMLWDPTDVAAESDAEIESNAITQYPWARLLDFLENHKRENPLKILIALPAPTPDWLEEIWPGRGPHYLLRSIIADIRSSNSKTTIPWTSYEDLPERLANLEEWVEWHCAGEPSESQFIRYCQCMAALKLLEVKKFLKAGSASSEKVPEDVKAGKVEMIGFHRFLDDPTGFTTREMHGVTAEQASYDGRPSSPEGIWARKIEILEFLAGRLYVPPSLPLKILVVDNNLDGLTDWAIHSANVFNELKGASGVVKPLEPNPLAWLEKAEWYVLDDHKKFNAIRTSTESPGIEAKIFKWPFKKEDKQTNFEQKSVPWSEIDLILQDIMLDKTDKEPTGLNLLPRYLDICPQALVFALTGMDVESLLRTGDLDWKYLDGVIPKRRLGSLWWQYVLAFRRRFGRMFWMPWLYPKNEPDLGDRQSLRNLFGCLRKWSLEPAILGHGQGVQEMIDHAHRHVSGVWRLADDVIGTLVENAVPGCVSGSDPLTAKTYLPVPELMLFAMSVWLHDIGHRGDDFTGDSVEIRSNHAGISEYLLLREPEAFGIEWLITFCHGKCKKNNWSSISENLLLRCRNSLACESNGELCPLRKLGLLCRHHQSNAPLDINSLDKMSRKGKSPSPYSRVNPAITEKNHDSQKDLEEWLDQDKPLVGWHGSAIRRLDEFELGSSKDAIISLAGLLRMVDALQLHRSRVGTPTSIKSFQAFLSTRRGWCMREIQKVEDLLRKTTVGTEAYQKTLAEYNRLRRYERLLNVQYVHLWRQIAVRDISVKWIWNSSNETFEKCPHPVIPAEAEIREAKILDYRSHGNDKSNHSGEIKMSRNNAALRMVYQLDNGGIALLNKMKATILLASKKSPIIFDLVDVLGQQAEELLKKDNFKSWLNDPNRKPLNKNENGYPLCRLWAIHVRDDVILSEHESQKPKSGKPAYVRFLPDRVTFEVATSGLASDPLPLREEVILLGREDFK